jgi:hypothetical protein
MTDARILVEIGLRRTNWEHSGGLGLSAHQQGLSAHVDRGEVNTFTFIFMHFITKQLNHLLN